MERVTWKLILPYVRQIASGNLLYDSGSSNQDSVTTQRGGMGWEVGGRFKREGTYVYLWLISADVQQKTTKFYKAIILQLKKKSASQCQRHRRHGFDPWVGKIPQRKKWPPTPVFLPGESHGQRNLEGYSPQGHKKSDTTQQLSTHRQCRLQITIVIILLQIISVSN